MSRILLALLILSGLPAAASASLAAGAAVAPCPISATPRQAQLPPLKSSPEGIWHTSIGSGTPIIFIHGWTMDHHDEAGDYEPVLTRRSGWRRIYVDLPGMGRSAGTVVRDQDEMLQKLLAFIDRELGGGGFAIAGSSAGAYLAQAVADRRRDRVTGLLLRMPMTVPEDDQRDRSKANVLVAGRPGAEHDAIVQTPCYLASLARKNSERVAPAQARANRATLDPIRSDPSRYALSPPHRPSDEPLAVPALIVAGRQDDSVGYRDAWRLAERYPRASYVALDRAEHGFPIDPVNRALFEALVNDWLSRVRETAAADEAH